MSLLFLVIIAILCPCIKMDILAPCLPDLASDLKISDGTIPFLFTITFFGNCLGTILSGLLSDFYGRRKIIITGNTIMLVATLGCAFVPSIDVLCILHFLKGIGASTVLVMVYAIIADRYESKELVNVTGTLNAAIAISMAVALILGSLINHVVGWRGNYMFLALFSLISLCCLIKELPETKTETHHFGLAKAIQDYRTLLSNSRFIIACIVPSLLYAAYMAFFAASSFLYIKTFHLSTLNYALQQALIVTVFALTSLLAGKIFTTIGQQKMIKLGIILCLVSCAGLTVTCVGFPSAYAMTIFMSIFCIGFAISYLVVFSKSFDVYANLRGTAISINMSMRALLVFTFNTMTSFGGGPINLVIIMSLGVVLACVLIFSFFMKQSPGPCSIQAAT